MIDEAPEFDQCTTCGGEKRKGMAHDTATCLGRQLEQERAKQEMWRRSMESHSRDQYDELARVAERLENQLRAAKLYIAAFEALPDDPDDWSPTHQKEYAYAKYAYEAILEFRK